MATLLLKKVPYFWATSLAWKFAKLALMETKSWSFIMELKVALWFQHVNRWHASLRLNSTIRISLFGSNRLSTLSHVTNSDTCTVRASIAFSGWFRRKGGLTCGGKSVLTRKVAKSCSQIWYQCKARTIRKAIIIFLAQQSTAMLTIFAHEEKEAISPPLFLVPYKIASDRNKNLPVNARIIKNNSSETCMANLKWIKHSVWQKPLKNRNIAFYTLCTNNDEKSTLSEKKYPLKNNIKKKYCYDMFERM